MPETQIDQEYYEVAKPGSFAQKLMTMAREKIYLDFINTIKPNENTKILDVGVSNVHIEGANWMEVKYPYRQNIAACGLDEAIDFQRVFPEIEYRKIIPGALLPYDNNAFDVATSNAVLEHVGSCEGQLSFVNELLRVSCEVFISVPNRFFPVEHHTAIPLLHYNDWMFNWACRLFNKKKWAQPENLILMSPKRLRELAPKKATIRYTGLNLGPFSSNIFMHFKK